MQSAGDRLMSENRRGRHVVLPVDQLMPLPIVGEEQVVVVGELHARAGGLHVVAPGHEARDRKSTRLNSSHITISYAVFCLKKKTYAVSSRLTHNINLCVL